MSSDGEGTSGGSKIEVAIRQEGEPYLIVRLGIGQATVGRGDEATIQLESKHVSRIHFTVEVRPDSVRVIDAGSRNGIKVNGRKVKEKEIRPKDVVAVPGFELAFRPVKTERRETTKKDIKKRDTIGGGWDDYLEAGDLDPEAEPEREEITNVTAQHDVDRTPPPGERVADPLDSTGSVLNQLAHRRETGRRRPFTADFYDDEEEREFSTPPDVEPLVLRLKDEANGLLYGNNDGQLAVEVIEAWDDTIHRVALLMPGQSYWWGGKPGLFTRPSDDCFPVVAYPEEGEYLVQRPDDPSWEVFYRGERELDVQRIAGLISCVAEWEDQVEVRHGTFSIYVRCIRLPASEPGPPLWQQLVPGKVVLAALVGSLVLHAVVGVLPMPRTLDPYERMRFDQERTDYVEYMLEAEPEPEPEPEEPPPPPVPEPEPEPEVAPPPQPEAMPDLGPTKKDLTKPEGKKKRREPRERAGNPDAQDEAPLSDDSELETDPAETLEEPAPPRPPRKQVSVDSFKVYGMIGHLPELKLDPGQANRGSRRVLHGAKAKGVVSKAPNLMGISPLGTLSKEQISRVVNTKTREVYGCYRELLKTHPTAKGRVEIRWTVDPQGKVTMVKVLRDTVGSTSLVRCLRDVVRSWVFPPPKGGGAQVTFPFTFRQPKL